MRLRCASLRSDAVTAVRSRGLAATAWRSTARHRASGHATDAPGHRANVAATVRGRLLSSLRAPLPNLAAKIDGRACEGLRTRGYAVVDGFLGETWCHLLRAVHESWPPRHRRDASSTACQHPSHRLICAQVARRHHHVGRAAVTGEERDASRAARHDVLTGQE